MAFHLTQNEFKMDSCIIQYYTFDTTGVIIKHGVLLKVCFNLFHKK